VRAVDVAPGGRVSTIVGTDLFAFGDKDGVGDDVLLQHPLGVLFHDGVLYVADTYNNRLKRCGVATRTVASWTGSGARGHLDGPLDTAMFDEPSGLAVARGRLYVADTNNHAIRIIDLAAGEVSTLELQGLNAPS
jgi:sugar lactone lactonase YvrE